MAELLALRQMRLERAQALMARAEQALRRALAEEKNKTEAAAATAEQNKLREAELALEVFSGQTVMPHIEKFRHQVAQLRQQTAQARAEAESAGAARREAEGRRDEAAAGVAQAVRALEKLQFGQQQWQAEAALRAALQDAAGET